MTPEELMQAAIDTTMAFNATRDRINADESLSLVGRQEQINAAAEKANSRITTLHEKFDQQRADKISSWNKRFFGPPPLPLSASTTDKLFHEGSYRDAIQKAELTASSEELLSLQETAFMTGDVLLAQATMVAGVKRGDTTVVDGWLAQNPQSEPDLRELSKRMGGITQLFAGLGGPSLQETFQVAGAFRPVG